MTAKILDGRALAKTLRAGFRPAAEALSASGVPPGLAVILVGEDPASQVYVRNKVGACAEAGFYSEKHVFPGEATQAEVLAKIHELNADPKIHGILVQLPLPPQFDTEATLDAIATQKDVDGFRAENVGALVQGLPCFVPCTPRAVMRLLEEAGIEIAGREAVVIGRSNIVGKPMAMLLLHAGATVTVCHSRTRDLAAHCRRADILVAAIGKPRFIVGDMIKPGAAIIDVGINRLPDGKLCGDVDFESASALAAYITPVPGGVGPMTIAMLLANTLDSARRAAV